MHGSVFDDHDVLSGASDVTFAAWRFDISEALRGVFELQNRTVGSDVFEDQLQLVASSKISARTV